MTIYGLTPSGFIPKPQSAIVTEMQQSLNAALGKNLNFAPTSVFSQLIGIFSEREALLWQLGLAVYSSQYPSGAEGTSVDNVLALNNLKRLGAAPTMTQPTTTDGTPGLVAFGTVGTLIPKGSIVSVDGSPSTQFTTDADATISAAVDAVQQIAFAGGIPTTGAFTLLIPSPTQPGASLFIAAINWNDNAAAVQTKIRAAVDAFAGNMPFTDVVVTGSVGVLLTLSFGAGTPAVGQPSSGGIPIGTATVYSNSLQDGSVVVNVSPSTTVVGHAAEAILAATCTRNGPTFVAAGKLTVIGSPVSGWTSVTNPLDCITGRDIESDTAALMRRTTLLSESANGPVQAIAEKVQTTVRGVVQARGFQNLALASEQIVAFTGTPTAGSLTLTFAGLGGFPVTTAAIPWNALARSQQLFFSLVPTGGAFQLAIGALTTGSLTFAITAAGIQNAIRALTPGGGVHPYADALVSGSFSVGFTIGFGADSQLPVTVASNTLTPGTVITVIPSVQSLVNALSGYAPATVVGSFAAGFDIAFNGSVGGQPQPLAIAVNSLTGVSAIAVTFGRPGKSFEIVVDDSNGEAQNADIAKVIFDTQPAGIESYGNTLSPVTDSYGSVYPIEFSRPTQIPIYVVVNLVTDLGSSLTPKFSAASIPTIQEKIVAAGKAFQVGGTIVGSGTGGLIGSFNDVPGIVSYQLYFGTAPAPTASGNIELQPTQVALFELLNVIVSYS